MILQGLRRLFNIYDNQNEENLEREMCNNNRKLIEICKKFSKQWIINTASYMSDDGKLVDKKIEENVIKQIQNFVDLQRYCKPESEYDTMIYSYFLYFCGVLIILTKAEDYNYRYQEYLNSFKSFFDQAKIRYTKSRKSIIFFEFLRIYLDLVDPKIRDITVFEDLRKCLMKDNYNIIFEAIEKEHELMKLWTLLKMTFLGSPFVVVN